MGVAVRCVCVSVLCQYGNLAPSPSSSSKAYSSKTIHLGECSPLPILVINCLFLFLLFPSSSLSPFLVRESPNE